MTVAVHENGVRTKLGGGTQGHSRMHTKLASFIRCGSHNSPLVALSSNDDSLAFERRIEQLFHGDEESIHVDVEDGFDLTRQGSGNP